MVILSALIFSGLRAVSLYRRYVGPTLLELRTFLLFTVWYEVHTIDAYFF